jgi:hypothetical protein
MILKQAASILLIIAFFISNITMPFCNFQETGIVADLYHQHLQEDADGNVFDFIADDILIIGSLFDEEDEDIPPAQQHPIQHPFPFPVTQIQTGFFNLSKPVTSAPQSPVILERVYSAFLEKKHSSEFSLAVFRPPSATNTI